MLWVDKWRPARSADVAGNPGAVAAARRWLEDWRPGRKALLVAGPPGVGKTSSVTLLARELGYDPVEVNASDSRGAGDAAAAKGVGGKLANALRGLCATGRTVAGRRPCLIMDEVDGMSTGDRGGVAELVALIKTSRVPVACLCNDKHSQSLRALRAHVVEVDFMAGVETRVKAALTRAYNKRRRVA